jgi:hypothetical protein
MTGTVPVLTVHATDGAKAAEASAAA